MTRAPDIRGVMAVVTLGDGRVTASHGDFETNSYGGFDLYQAQTMRAEQAAVRKAVGQFVGPAMAQWLSGYTIERIWHDMRQHGGARITLIPVGWTGDAAEEIKRRSAR